MSSPLPLIVFGHVYFLSNSSLVVHNGPNSSRSIDQGFTIPNEVKPVSQVPPIQRKDYTYTPGVGAHKAHKDEATWYNAKQICRQEGGDLAIINSAAEAALIVSLLAALGPNTGIPNSARTFIGFHDVFSEGRFEAVDGQSLSDGLYNQWKSGEPNGGAKENCGTIITRDGKLNDDRCDAHYGFVCELPNPY